MLKQDDIIKILSNIIKLLCDESRKCVIKPLAYTAIELPKTLDEVIPFLQKLYRENKVNIKDYKIVDLIKLIIKYVKTRDELVLDAIYKLYTKFDSNMKMTFNPKALSVKQLVHDLLNIIDDQTDIIPPYHVLLKMKEESPVLYQKYREYLKIYMDNLKKIASTIFSKKHNKPMPLEEFNKEIQKYGFLPIYNNVQSDIIYVDNNLRLLLRNGKYLKCNIPLYGTVIIFNNEYRISKDNTFVLKFRSKGANVWQYCYTVDFKLKKQKMIFKKISDLLDNIDKYRKKWLADLKSKDPFIRQIAILVELAYLTSGRIGTKGNQTQGKSTYGLSTLLKKHFTVKGDKIIIKYPGKSGVIQTHIITKSDNDTLFEVLKKHLSSKRSDEPVFTVTGDYINEYLRKRIGINITIHKFRKLIGTKMVYDEIKKISCKQFKSETDIMKFLKNILLKVGEVLGHISGTKVTHTTALKNYVDPKILEYPFVKCGYPIPKAIQQLSEQAMQFSELSTSASIGPAQVLGNRMISPNKYPRNLLDSLTKKFF